MTSTNPALRQDPNPPRRADLSWRYAMEADLERVSFTITLGRWQPIHDLSKRANRILRFFAALNRLGAAGYRGTRCSQGALAAAIARATEEAANKRTVQRGLAELAEAGYLEQSTAYGPRSRQIGPDCWRREQICVYTLTDKAIRLWSHTSIPMTKCRGDDQMKPENKSQSFPGARSMPKPESETVTNRSVEPEAQFPQASTVSKSPSARQEEKSGEKQEQHGSPPQTTKPAAQKNAKRAILECLKWHLSDRGRQGKIAIARAAMELSGGKIIGDKGTGIPWDYWGKQWQMLTREEQMSAVKSEILPKLLLSHQRTAAPPPCLSQSKGAPPPSNEPRKRQPTEADTIRNLQGLEQFGWEPERLAWIASLMKIGQWDEESR